MKRLLAVVLTILLICGLAGCGAGNAPAVSISDTPLNESAVSEDLETELSSEEDNSDDTSHKDMDAAAEDATEIAQITVAVPYFPDLQITFTNVPRFCGEIASMPDMQQVKFYYNENTTLSFNDEITFSALGSDTAPVTLKAGETINANDYPSGTLQANFIADNSTGAYTISADGNLNTQEGQTVYMLSFIDVSFYEENLEGGYTFTDISDWDVDGDKSTIAIDYDGDGGTDYSYTIPGTESGMLQLVDLSEFKDTTDMSMQGVAGKEFPVYTISAGQKIYIPGAVNCYFNPMELEGEKLRDRYDASELASLDASAIFALHKVNGLPVDLGPDQSYTPYGYGSYFQFIQEGYYLFAPAIFVPELYVTDTAASDWGSIREDAMFNYGAVILHVVAEK